MNIAIIGAGKLGKKLAYALLNGNHSVTIVDKNEKALQKLALELDIMTVVANAKDVSFLKELNIKSYDYLIALTGNDELNILISSFAKKLGCHFVIARIRDPEYMSQFDFIKNNMDINHLVNPDLAITNEIYKHLVEKYTLTNGIFTTGKVALIEFKAKNMPVLLGVPLNNVNRILKNMLVVAISRNGKVIVPQGDDEICPTYTNLKKVMVIGGGKTGLYLSKKLSEFGVSVKVIERNMDRCRYLAEKLEDVMILNGDGTDKQLLEEESIADMDGFVTATGYDEDNLLLALMAKEYNIAEVVAKVSRGIYTELVSNLGVDMAINPVDIVTSNLAKLIQGKEKIISNQLIQGQAEITEIIASKNMKIVGTPIKEIGIPTGVLIGAIHRDGGVIIPDGNTIIKEGDKVLIFSLLTSMAEMAKYTR